MSKNPKCSLSNANYHHSYLFQVQEVESKRKDSHIDITFIDKEVEGMEEDKPIGPKDLVDIMA